METASYTDIMLGDVVVTDGTALAPVDCIILRNYPAEPDYSYWGGESEGPVEDTYTGPVNVDFYNFDNRNNVNFNENGRGFIYADPAGNDVFYGKGYSITVGEFNESTGTNPIFIVKRPGSTGKDYSAILPNTGYTDSRKTTERPLNPRVLTIQLSNPRSAEGSTKLITEFDYSAKANAQGNITLNNSLGEHFFTINMNEKDAKIEDSVLYDYSIAGGNDGFTKIQIVIDRTAKTADIYVDGELKASGAALSANFTDMQSISFTQTADTKEKQTGDVYIDNVNIYECDTVDTTVIDAVPAKRYLVDDNFDGISAAMGALNNVESGSVPLNAWWHQDGNGRKNVGIEAKEEGSSDMSIAIENAASGNTYLRFPVAPLFMGDARTDDNMIVFEWDMKYTGALGKNFLALTFKNDLSSPTTGKNTIFSTNLGYDAGADTNEYINQKWHKVLITINKATAEYKIYKAYTDESGKKHAILTNSGTGTVYEKMEIMQISRKISDASLDAKAYIDNLKVYEAPESMVRGEYETMTE